MRREGKAREKGEKEWGHSPVITSRLRTFPKQSCQTVGHKTVSGSAFALSICTKDSQEMGKDFAHGAKK